jgi:hypothetical protein
VTDPKVPIQSRTVIWERSRIPLLYPALQKGVLVKARVGGTVRSFLCEQLGLDPDYVKSRIQTAFLNGKPVDDFESALITDGSVLTLSGALPGLAGATLRKGGFYRSLRASVSYSSAAGKEQDRRGFVTLRVFNILLPELAPVLAARGIFLPRQDFEALKREIETDKEPVSVPSAARQNPPAEDSEWIELRVAN